jgi:myo-inositol catabolism protein IolC
MPYSVVYNVTIKGFSVGLTFDPIEAKAWLKGTATADKKIIIVPYRKANV